MHYQNTMVEGNMVNSHSAGKNTTREVGSSTLTLEVAVEILWVVVAKVVVGNSLWRWVVAVEKHIAFDREACRPTSNLPENSSLL